MKLYAGRWSTDGTTMHPDSAMLSPENVGVNWRLDTYGVQRIEVLVRARNKYDQYARYRDHLGQRLALYDSKCYRPISGFITDVEYAGAGRVLYSAKGPGAARLEDERDTTIYATSTGLDDVLKTVLTDHVSVASSDQSNIDNNTTTIGGSSPDPLEGATPKEMIDRILKIADSSGNIWDFWFQDEPFSGVTLQSYTPYYAVRSTSASIDWVVYSRDLSQMTVARDINNILTEIEVFGGGGIRTATTGTSGTTVVVTGTGWADDGLTPGDRMTNVTDGSYGQVATVSGGTATVNSWSGGATNSASSGDTITTRMEHPATSQTVSTTSDYWDRSTIIYERDLTRLRTSYYATTLLQGEPTQVQAFTVGAPRIRTGNGARVPLWEVIAQGGGYIRWADMYPAATQFSNSLNKETTFRITGLDYDYARNQLAVTLDNPSTRLDSRLRRAGILGSDMIQRGMA